jgi:hypothetical protein
VGDIVNFGKGIRVKKNIFFFAFGGFQKGFGS